MICTLFPHKCDCYNSICKIPTTFSIIKWVLLQRFWVVCNLFCKNALLCAENLFGNTLHIEDCSRNLQTIVLWDNYTSKHPTVQANLQFCLKILTDRIFISIINITICGKVQTICNKNCVERLLLKRSIGNVLPNRPAYTYQRGYIYEKDSISSADDFVRHLPVLRL